MESRNSSIDNGSSRSNIKLSYPVDSSYFLQNNDHDDTDSLNDSTKSKDRNIKNLLTLSYKSQDSRSRSSSRLLLPQAIEVREKQYRVNELNHNVLIVDMTNNSKIAHFQEIEMTVQELFNSIYTKIKSQKNYNYDNIFNEHNDLHILNIRNLMLKSLTSKINIEKDQIRDQYGSIYHNYDDSISFAKNCVILSIEDINCIVTFKTLYLLIPVTFDKSKLDAIKEAFSTENETKPTEFEYRVYDRILLIFKNQLDNDIITARDMFIHIKNSLVSIEQESCILSSNFEMDLRYVLNRLKKLETKILKYKTFFEKLIDGNEKMIYMSLHQYLKPDIKSLSDIDYQLVKILFEEYLVYYSSFLNTVTAMKTSLDTRIEILKLRLDSSQNELGLLQNYITLLFVCFSLASFVANTIVGNLFDDIMKSSVTYFSIITIGSIAAYYVLRKFKVIPRYIMYKRQNWKQKLCI